MSVFNDTFQTAMAATASAHGTHASTVYTQNVNSAIDAAFEAIQAEAHRVQNVDIKFSKGNIAEAYHAGTFNAGIPHCHRAHGFGCYAPVDFETAPPFSIYSSPD